MFQHFFGLAIGIIVLEQTFDKLLGGKCYVEILGKTAGGGARMFVGWAGDEMVRAVQLEEFLRKQGAHIVERPKQTVGRTIMVYESKGLKP